MRCTCERNLMWVSCLIRHWETLCLWASCLIRLGDPVSVPALREPWFVLTMGDSPLARVAGLSAQRPGELAGALGFRTPCSEPLTAPLEQRARHAGHHMVAFGQVHNLSGCSASAPPAASHAAGAAAPRSSDWRKMAPEDLQLSPQPPPLHEFPAASRMPRQDTKT